MTGDVASLFARQKSHRRGDVLRPVRCASAECGPASSPSTPPTAVRHVGFDESRRDGIHGDIAAAHLLRERFRQSDQPGLRRHVIRLPRIARLADHRRNLMIRPQRSASCLQHLLDRQKRAGQIGGDHGVPIVLLHAQRQAVFGDAGVVDQNGDRPEILGGFGERVLDGIGDWPGRWSPRMPRVPASGSRRPVPPAVSVLRAASTTRAPACASARAHARPMPRLAPVMNAVRFVMRLNFHHSKT